MTCDHRSRTNEEYVERYLLNNIEEELEKFIVKSEVEPIEIVKPKFDKSKIKAEIDRLNKMYQKGRIEDDEYDEEYDRLQHKLDQCEQPTQKRDLRPLKEFLKSDFKTIYETLTREEKRSMWRSIIRRMVVHDYENIDIDFIQ